MQSKLQHYWYDNIMTMCNVVYLPFFFFYCNPTSIIIIDDNDILLSCVSCITTQIAMWLLCEMLEIVSRLCRNIEKLFVRWSCMIVNENTSHIFIMVSMITLHNSYQKHFIVWYFELIYIHTYSFTSIQLFKNRIIP